ncbi:hypothetical protein [Streptomyces sp. NRRL S-350]|uniref:hypothetical protein n=1 Tax=Streptomyces sp. NRRL S-350 TaxID=1463902 RepID=UPI0004C22146|nr:hypothetical protein [Streptomyces sp. NRRL S-350]
MIFDYADFACTEIINSVRATTYAQLYCLPIECDACPELPCALDHGDLTKDPYTPYVDPATDEAPWYDEAVPESANVLGFMGLDVTGFQKSTISRTPIPLVGDGSALGIARRAHRIITYTVLMIVRDECALEYGLSWLAASLSGCCDDGCVGSTLGVFACCPTCEGCDSMRYLYNVGLLEGPDVESLEYLTDGILARVTFSLIAGTPWIYRNPLTVSETWHDLTAGTTVVTDPDAAYDDCVQPADCLEDPECPSPTLPNRVPIPVDPCYPTGTDTFLRTVISIPVTDVPNRLDMVPVLELEVGSTDLRRIVVRFRASLTGTDCNDPLADPCGICTDLQTPYLPAGSVLTVDGRTQRAELECSTAGIGSATAHPPLYGAQGGAFQWPVFGCPEGMCIEILTTKASTGAGTRARVLMVTRTDAG